MRLPISRTTQRLENLLTGGGISSSPGSVSLEFEITPEFPQVTLVSMIAPSPDWFVGVAGLELCVDGSWVESLEVDLYAYDAGSDSGVNYTSPDDDTDPKENIARIEDEPFFVDEDLVAVGTFHFSRI